MFTEWVRIVTQDRDMLLHSYEKLFTGGGGGNQWRQVWENNDIISLVV